MSQIANTNAAANSAGATNTLVGNSVEDLDLDVFLDLMLTELQNQDPLNPMENDELLNTISQIREISANDKLSDTLSSVLLGQNVATATSLIGAEVVGLTDAGQRVVGAVRQVAINDGEPQLELAVETGAEAGDSPGGITEGEYTYEVVWETEDGLFSVQATANTEEFGDDFNGSIRLENLPELAPGVRREVYRTDGSGDPQLVGTLPFGNATSFTDQKANNELGSKTLTEQRSVLRYADAITISLNNVSQVQTLD